VNNNQLRNALFALFTVGGAAVVGVKFFGDAPASHVGALTVQAPCIGDTCFVCLQPTAAECTRWMLNGGEPAYDPTFDGSAEPYGGANGRFARLVRAGIGTELITFHAEWISAASGTCRVIMTLTPQQRRAWRQTVDANAVGSEVGDCRKTALGGRRTNVPAGIDPDAAEDIPTDDAGPEPDGGQ
jgi:hypothetical protein